MATKININANIESDNKYGIDGEKSLKSLRTYQLGVVYKDEYGRETPVFTNEDASFTIPKAFSNTKNSITAEVKNRAPGWAHSYKLFIKETSNEYYNLCMDRWYDADDENIWLSFPSAERNKIQEDTFIILKKQAASQESITEEARYKIIDIQNEAPDDIKTDYEMYGTANIEVHLGATPESSDIKLDFSGGSNPWDTTPFYDGLLDNSTTASGTNSAGFVGYPLEDVVVKFANTANDNTGWLDVSNIYKDTASPPELHIQLSKPLKGSASDSTGSIVDICPGGACDPINVKLAKKVVKNKSEFNGRFFVKIRKDELINQYIRSVGNPAPFFEIKQTMKHQALNVNTANSDSPYWATVTRQWFIDNCSRRQTGVYSGAGGGGPWYEDDGYGLEGSGSNDPPIAPGWNNSTYSGTRSSQSINAHPTLQCTMELSFSHIDDENLNGFSMANALDSSDREFMEKMSTVGTMFRWKEDPYQHIYRIVAGTKNSQTGGTNGNGILNFGERNWQRKSKRNKTIRLYLKFKTTGYRLNDDQGTGGGSPAGTIQYYDNEADKWPFFYKSGGSSYNPEDNGDISTDPTVAAYERWNPTKSGYTAAGYSVTSNAYDSITQDTTSTESIHPNTPNPASPSNTIQIVDIGPGDAEPIFTDNPAVWETEPKEDKGLDIYYEASQAYPLSLNDKTYSLFAPAGAKVSCVDTINNKSIHLPSNTIIYAWAPTGHGGDTILLNKKIDTIGIIDHTQGIVSGINPILGDVAGTISNINSTLSGIELKFTRQDGSYTTAKVNYVSGYCNSCNPPASYFVNGIDPGYSCGTPGVVPSTCADSVIIKLDRDISNGRVKLPYFNCYTFGNGVESDRIRDDFNAVKLDKGVKASTVLDEPYEEEQRTNGLIYSGIYNSSSGINNLNQFIAAEKITKDVNPSYGSIQKLKTRDTNLVTFCEDKVLKILANKDAVYNADGNPQLVATNNVLGQTTSFAGEFGISRNPESFAEEAFRMYFTDKQRGKVLRLSGNGITPISSVGMKDYFADNLKLNNTLIGSFDDRKDEYNLTLKETDENIPLTVSFSETAKGWTSFKSFIQDGGLSLNNNYYTFKGADENNLLLWEHHSNEIRNNFYGDQYNSYVDVLFNEESATVKSFASMKYEGSQAKITKNLTDEEYYNNISKDGWYVESGETDLQKAGEMEFKDKEGKWFSYMKGTPVKGIKDLNSKEFSFQGIDKLQSTPEQIHGCTNPSATNYNPEATIDDGSCIGDCSSVNIGALWLVDVVNGSLELTPGVNAEDLPHTYIVTNSNGVTYPNTSGPNPNPGGVYTYWTGLPQGQYTFTIVSDSDCQELENFQIGSGIVYGCTDPLATNYNPNATDDDGSCVYPNPCELVIASLSATINTSPDTGTGNGGAQVVFDDPAGILPPGTQVNYAWYGGTVTNNVQDNTLVASSTGISTGVQINAPTSQNYVNNLAAGNYHVSVDTGDGCYRWFDFVIDSSGSPAPLWHRFERCDNSNDIVTFAIWNQITSSTYSFNYSETASQWWQDKIETITGTLNIGDILSFDLCANDPNDPSNTSRCMFNGWYCINWQAGTTIFPPTSSVDGTCFKYLGLGPQVPTIDRRLRLARWNWMGNSLVAEHNFVKHLDCVACDQTI